MADLVGQQLGSFRLVRLLGHGGFANVYLAEHVRLTMQVAIKVLHSRLDEQEVASFRQEAQTVVDLIHPSIVRVLDFDVQNGMPYLVMDYAPNGSLRESHPKGSRVPLPLVVSSVQQIAEALQYAHDQKRIHRDVKPENMLLGKRFEVLLGDFGIATLAHSTASLLQQTIAGTLPYMAPEQIERYPRPASDQYSLGIVVYEWLCGERPFQGSQTELVVKHCTIPPPPLREKMPAIATEVEQVVLTALAKDPKQRFACVRDFAQALTQASQTSQRVLSAPPLATEPPHRQAERTQDASAPQQRPNPPDTHPVSPLTPIHVSVPLTSRKRVRRPLFLGMIALVGVGLLIFGFIVAPSLPHLFGAAGTSAPSPTSTTPRSTASAVNAGMLPGTYSGPIHNTLRDISSTMTLTIYQGNDMLYGQFTVAAPLSGSGPFTGSVGSNKTLEFTVISKDATATAPIHFTGTIQSNGSLFGDYCSVNAQQVCDTNAGGHGTWSVTRNTS